MLKKLGFWQLSALVVGNMVGSGIFLLPASLALFGAIGLLGWLLSAVGAICLAIVFSRLSQHFPKIGGPYAYAREGFGEFVGFQMAWSYWIGAWAGNAAIVTACISYLSYFYPTLEKSNLAGFVASLALVWGFTAINVWSVRSAGIVQLVLTVIKLIPLLAISIVGIFYVDLSNFQPFNPSGQSFFAATCAAAALTLYAFLGLESATVPADSVIDPAKNIPRATIFGTILSAVIYVSSTFVLMGLIHPSALQSSNAPFAEAGRLLFGTFAGQLVAVCAVLSAAGTLNGWILIQGQIPLAAAQDGLLPAAFKKLSSRGTPVFGLVISSIFMSGILLLNFSQSLVEQFTAIVNLTTFAILVPYLYSTIADLLFTLVRADYVPKRHLAINIVVTLLGFAYSLLIVIGSGQQAVFWGIMWIFLGFPLYVFMKKHHKKEVLEQHVS